MVTGPLVGIPPFSPIAQTVPMSYRDLDTNLTLVQKIADKLNEVINAENVNNAQNTDEHNRIVSELTDQFNAALATLRHDLEQLVADSHDESVAFNPTSGRQEGLSKVVSDTFDNARVFAYFAGDYDALELTAAEYDTIGYSARHFDLAPLYPTLNDVYTGV